MHTFHRRHNKDIESNRWYREQRIKKRISHSIASPIRFGHAQLVNQSRLVGRGRKERCTGWSWEFIDLPFHLDDDAIVASRRHSDEPALSRSRTPGGKLELWPKIGPTDEWHWMTLWHPFSFILVHSAFFYPSRWSVMPSHPFAWTLSYFECSWKFWIFKSDLGLYISMHDYIW